MNIIRVMREVAQELRRLGQPYISEPLGGSLCELAGRLKQAIEESWCAVDMAICVGAECIELHGLRVATWRGTGSYSIYCGVCDECHAERLTDEERKHMVELFGAAWVRHLGLHKLHLGRRTAENGEPGEARDASPRGGAQ